MRSGQKLFGLPNLLFSLFNEIGLSFYNFCLQGICFAKKQGILFNIKFQAASADTLPSCIFTNIPLTLPNPAWTS